jgi:predicted unusual protein kinase regulating ubiquinone biosynthesis (AarF/ABC1/UbiB family)
MTASFGLPPSELFDWIEEEPIACGSIGQVHRGRLSAKGAALTGCEAGDLVAIKVKGCCCDYVTSIA